MKRLFSLMLVAIIILAACNSKLSISELQSVPSKVQDVIKSDSTLQMITNGEKNTYIVFHSTEAVSVELEVTENILNIKFNTTNQENTELKQYVYKLNRGDSEHDTINVLVNEENMPFDGGRTIF
ncbi:peptidylprolyl isomerase [Lysinibacillus sp. 2017]|nr:MULTISPECIES: peptidylprolyl isomerase [unclassified Lysinibacillus]AWE07261.1 peptidylprolyl isomerase [Lysinibacillus sp. 2017]TGN33318.1 peptidylprolyl isomerase [Lysinibacillus sp. S2017]